MFGSERNVVRDPLARDDEPTLTATGTNPTFTENGAAVDLFSSPVASTVEANQEFIQAIIQIDNVSGNFAGDYLTIDGTDIPIANASNLQGDVMPHADHIAGADFPAEAVGPEILMVSGLK